MSEQEGLTGQQMCEAIARYSRDVWEPAAATAKARGDNLRDVTVRALREYGKEE